MLKKAGLLTVGVTAGLLAVAPIASAGVSDDHDDDKNHSKHDSDHDRDDDHGDDDGDHNHDGGDGDFSNSCSSEAGDIDNDATGEGGLAGIGQVAGPVASGSNVDVLNCTNILNDILNDNDVAVSVLGDAGAGLTS